MNARWLSNRLLTSTDTSECTRVRSHSRVRSVGKDSLTTSTSLYTEESTQVRLNEYITAVDCVYILLRAFNMFQAQLYMSKGNKDKVFSIRLMNSLQDYASTGMLVAVL